MPVTHISSAYEVYQTTGSADDQVGSLANFASLVAGCYSSIDNHWADYSVVRELACFVVDLYHQLACWTNNDGLWLLNNGERAAFHAITQHRGQYR